MKKAIAWILALMLALGAAAGCAEEAENFFARFEGVEWSFCSGAGGWSTDMQISPDGSFSGTYHDSEMGETGEGYPNGTLYLCIFSGHMSLVGQADENSWRIRVDALEEAFPDHPESIEEGMRLVYTTPYGLTAGDEMTLYRPGTPVDGFTEEMKIWAHLYDYPEGALSELKSWFLYSEANDTGFEGIPGMAGMSIANPWTDMTAEQLRDAAGKDFALPEGAENAVYRWLGSESMAEIQFSWKNSSYCFRAQPAAGDGGLVDISGMYLVWEHEESVTVGGCAGIIGQAHTETGETVERCLWADGSGMAYSLSVTGADLDGLDLAALAEQIYLSAAR